MVKAPGGGGGTALGERVIKLEGQVTARERLDSTGVGQHWERGQLRGAGSTRGGGNSGVCGGTIVPHRWEGHKSSAHHISIIPCRNKINKRKYFLEK